LSSASGAFRRFTSTWVEWDPGIYGAELARHCYDRVPARSIGREQAARLVAILPAPLKRRLSLSLCACPRYRTKAEGSGIKVFTLSEAR
jgi:hypothetical protein